jgi:hypothetical protein
MKRCGQSEARRDVDGNTWQAARSGDKGIHPKGSDGGKSFYPPDRKDGRREQEHSA